MLDWSKISDAELMQGVAAREEESLRELIQRYSLAVIGVCRKIIQDAEEADDLAVDIFAELWNRCDQYTSSRAEPSTYIMVLARSRCNDRLRSRMSTSPLTDK